MRDIDKELVQLFSDSKAQHGQRSAESPEEQICDIHASSSERRLISFSRTSTPSLTMQELKEYNLEA
jgi:hypothetical protein